MHFILYTCRGNMQYNEMDKNNGIIKLLCLVSSVWLKTNSNAV